jgi:hypothetical protein
MMMGRLARRIRTITDITCGKQEEIAIMEDDDDDGNVYGGLSDFGKLMFWIGMIGLAGLVFTALMGGGS